MTNLLKAVFATLSRDISDISAAAVYVWKGREKTPAEVKEWNERYAETPPDWWHGSRVAPVEVPASHTIIEQTGKGFPWGWAGEFLYDDPTKKAVTTAGIDEILTPYEVAQMKAYRVSPVQVGLNNLTLASRIKPYWQAGKKPGEIAVLAGCSESTAKHYCTCFRRANEIE